MTPHEKATTRGAHRLATLMLCIMPAAAIPACTGLEPAAVGAGASAAESGVAFFAKGQATTFEPVMFVDAVAAARRAANLLNLSITADEPGLNRETDRRHRFVFRDERSESTVVVIERRTETITLIHADVGTFGPTPMASLIVNTIMERLRAAGAYERVHRDSAAE